MKSYGLKLFKPVVERNLLIVIPKEAGIVEAGAQNSLVAVANDGHAFRVDLGIQNREKMRCQRVLVILEREVFLMVTHDRDQNFFRQRQVLGLKVAEEHAWPLGKVGDLLHQGLVLTPADPGESAGSSIQGFADAMAARGDIGNHKGCLERREIVRGTGNGYGLFSVEDAMSIAEVGGADAGKLQRNHAFVQQAKQPAERTNKTLRLIGPPVHGLGPGERAYFLGQGSPQNLERAEPGPLHGGRGVFALGRGDLFQSTDWDAGFLGEGLGRRTWLPAGEGRLPRGTSKLLLRVQLLRQHARDAHCQAAWSGVAAHCYRLIPASARG